MLRLRKAIRGDDAPFAVRAHPELRVNFVFWDDLAIHNMAHEQIIIHRFCDDLRDRCRDKLDEAVVFRPACLLIAIQFQHTPDEREREDAVRVRSSKRTLLFRERRRRDISPNWEKYARI